MTPLFPAQRAAEEFDKVLDGSADSAAAARYAELLDAVEQLRTLPEVTPRAEFVGDLRSRLMTAAETELVVAPPVAAPLTELETRRRNRRLGTVAASLVIVGGSAGMAAAASSALPGEQLYPIKRGVEQVETAVRFNQASQGKAQLDQAATRLDEVRALQVRGAADPDVLAQTFEDFRTAADTGSGKLFASYESSGNESDIVTVRDFTATQMADIAEMAANADSVTNDLLRDAADTLASIDERARGLCVDCAPGTLLQPPAALAAGAGAVSMNNLIARPISQAQADVAKVDAMAKRLRDLRQQAEATAGEIPQLPAGSDPTAGLPGSPTAAGGPVTSALSPDGTLVPTITASAGATVKGLVGGVAVTLTTITGQVTGGGTVPDKLVEDLGETLTGVGDTVDGTLNGVGGVVGGLTQGVTPKPKP